MTPIRLLCVAAALIAIPACDRFGTEPWQSEPRTPTRESRPRLAPESPRAEAPHGTPAMPMQPSTPVGVEAPADMRPSAADDAAREITQARCSRESRCGNIGTGESYADESTCEREIRAAWRDELSAYECPRGVERAELSACLEQIRDEDCGNPFDTLARVMACESNDICREG